METVEGIGGLFFRSEDPDALAVWYQQHLGIAPVPTKQDQPVWNQAAGPTVFAPLRLHDPEGNPIELWEPESEATA